MAVPVAVLGCTVELSPGAEGECVITTSPSTRFILEGKGVYRGVIDVKALVKFPQWAASVPAEFIISPRVISKLQVDGQIALGEGDESLVVSVPGVIPAFPNATPDPQLVSCKITRANQSSLYSD